MAKQDNSKHLLPSAQELENLTRSDLCIYASRNALRVLPLTYSLFQQRKSIEEQATDAILFHIASSIGLFIDSIDRKETLLVVDAAASAAASAAAASDAASDAAVVAASYAAASADAAASAASVDASDDAAVAVAVNAAVNAAAAFAVILEAYHAVDVAAGHDFVLLQEKTFNSTEPLWPTGREPSHFEDALDKWREIMFQFGFSAHVDAYEKLVHGEIDTNSYVSLINNWLTEQNKLLNEDNNPQIDYEKIPEVNLAGLLSINAELAATNDHLGRQRLVNAMSDLLTHPEHIEPLTIGLLGDWGAGKTTTLNLLKKELNKSNDISYHVQLFNAWAYEHTDNIQAGVAQEAVTGLTARFNTLKSKLEIAYNLNTQLNPIKSKAYLGILIAWFCLILYLTFNGRVGTIWQVGISTCLGIWFFYNSMKSLLAHPFAKEFKTYLNLPNYSHSVGQLPVYQSQLKALSELCLDEKNRLLFVVDDLDRCSPEGIVKVFEAIRLVMELKNVTVIIAIDHRIALAALAHHYEYLADKKTELTTSDYTIRSKFDVARDYLGKIIQLPVNLDQPDDPAVKSYINHLFDKLVHGASPANKTINDEHGGIENTVPTQDPASTGTGVLSDVEKSKNVSEKISDDKSPAEKKGEETAENTTMLHTIEEHDNFERLSVLMNFNNPRQLKRLHSSYRLLRAYANSHNQAENLRLMNGLFWFEHLYSMDCTKANKLETKLRKRLEAKTKTESDRKYDGLFETIDEYNLVASRVTPFVLPQAMQ